MRMINLLPKSEQNEITLERHASELVKFVTWSISLMVLFLALILLAEVFIRQGISTVDKDIAAKQTELRSAANQKLQDEVLALNTQIKTIKTLRSQHYYWSNAIIEIANLLPADTSIDFVTMDRATGKIDIAGTANDRLSVLEFWANVKRSNMFKNINFPLSNLETARDTSFSYSFYINPQEVTKE